MPPDPGDLIGQRGEVLFRRHHETICRRTDRVFAPATVLVAADHFLRGLYWPESVFGVLSASSWRWLEHAAWVLFEDAFLINSCLQSLREMRDIARQRAELELVSERTERTVVV